MASSSSSSSSSTEQRQASAIAEVSGSGTGFAAVMNSARKYDGLVFFHHMIAGAAAGTVEHTAMFPVDTIKTRMQALSHPGQRLHNTSVRAALRSALKREGISGLYRGVGAVALGAGPAHAIHFGVYEFSKEALGGNTGSGHHPAIAGVSGAIATVVNEAIMTPVDVIKQRLQVAHSPYRNVMDCLQQTLRNEGVGALFKSYRTTLIMNIPFQAVHFAIYEGTKKVLLEPVLWGRQSQPTGADTSGSGSVGGSSGSSGGSSSSTVSSVVGNSSSSSDSDSSKQGTSTSVAQSADLRRGAAPGTASVAGAASIAEIEEEEGALDDNLATQLIAGGLAGGAAAALTTPLDVVKTRLQTEGVHSAYKYGGSAVLPTLRRIYQEEGAASLWRGLKPRVMFHVPAAAVCWGTYETLKSFLATSE